MNLLFSSEQAVIQYKMQILNNNKSREEFKHNSDNIEFKPSFGNYKMSEAKPKSEDVNQGSNRMDHMKQFSQVISVKEVSSIEEESK